MNKAVFLDRDGVINREIGSYVYTKEKFVINDELIPALQLLQQNDFLLIIISNQGGISKGLYTIDDVDELHNGLLDVLSSNGIEINAIYFCPHHTEQTRCLCRKPDSLMLERAITRFEIDKDRSYLIGDHERDILAAEKAKVTGILIESNSSLLSVCHKIINGEI